MKHSHAFPHVVALVLALAAPFASSTPQSPTQVTTRVSVNSSGVQGNGLSIVVRNSISADGRLIVFANYGSNLFPGQIGGEADVVLFDRLTGVLEPVSVDSNGVLGLGNSTQACVTPDGRFVVFESTAANLVPNDTNGFPDVFIRDRLIGTTERVNIDSSGQQADLGGGSPAITPDGRFVVFDSISSNLDPFDSNFSSDVFLHDRQTGLTERVSLAPFWSEANDDSLNASVSDDGRLVSFLSRASNLVPGDTNGVSDYFVRNRVTGAIERVNVSSTGVQALPGTKHNGGAAVLSADGRFVAFQSYASNLVAGDTNGWIDTFVHDRQTGVTERVSVSSAGDQASFPVLLITFQPTPSLSANGRFVAFQSQAANLVPGDYNQTVDCFVRDRWTGITERVSVNSQGVEADAGAVQINLSLDGRYSIFSSPSTNLVLGDTNFVMDVYVHDRMTGGPELALTNVVAGQVATFTVTGATPGGLVFVGVSLVGQGPIPSAWGPLELGSLDLILPYAADGLGAISTPISLPLGIVGLPLWVQGIDFTMDFPTSVWGGVIQ